MEQEPDLRALTRASVASVAPHHEVSRLVEVILPLAEEAYESALVQGLCLDGAREVLETTTIEEVRQRLGTATRH